MQKKIYNYLIDTILIIIFVFIFVNSNIVKQNIINGINIWLNTLIPTIFPFLLISKLLIYYNVIDILNFLFGKFISTIFKVSQNASFAILISIFTGFPTGAIYVKDLLESNLIDDIEANRLIMITSYSNPLFVISGIGETMLNNKRIGIYIFIIHLLTGLFISFLLKKEQKKHLNIAYTRKRTLNNSFINILLDSINNSFHVLINILGILIFFLIIISLIDTILPNNLLSLLLKGLTEITTGITSIVNSNYNLRLKASLIGAVISFNGISVHFQVKSIIENTKIKYNKYLIARLIHFILCFFFTYILFNIFIN